MSYKNDSLLVISNKYGKASAEAKAQLFETYDQLRDITVGGSGQAGSGVGTATSFLMSMARLVSPSSFMPTVNGAESANIPGTSYSSTVSGGSTIAGSNSSFGIGSYAQYSGFPSGGAASINYGIGTDYGYNDGSATGGAASIVSTAGAATVATTALDYGRSILIPTAGVISGLGSLISAVSPYLGQFGLASTLTGSLVQGAGGALMAAYKNVSGNILNNADVTLSNKVKNIETVCKMLDTQSDVIKKMLKESVEGDSKVIQDL